MAASNIEQVNASKTAHAQAILDKLAEAKALINSQPDLWFGGLPDKLNQAVGMLDFQAEQIRIQFGIAAPAPVEPAAPPAA